MTVISFAAGICWAVAVDAGAALAVAAIAIFGIAGLRWARNARRLSVSRRRNLAVFAAATATATSLGWLSGEFATALVESTGPASREEWAWWLAVHMPVAWLVALAFMAVRGWAGSAGALARSRE